MNRGGRVGCPAKIYTFTHLHIYKLTFSTPVHIPVSDWQIGYDDHLLLLGSCFSDHIAAKLKEHYFQVTANPFGTLYNPLSIANALSLAATGQLPEWVEWGGLYHSMYHHGSFSRPTAEQTAETVGESMKVLRKAFEKAQVVIITFGTAWVYEYEGQVVANCHKMPANKFERRRLTVEEIVEVWQPIVEAHKEKHFLFTVSPIRHIKDGLHENQLSKAVLLMAIDRLQQQVQAGKETQTKGERQALTPPTTRVAYFPSYEIVQDELRDYRFYAEDMVHPSTVAVEYIWERFVAAYFSEATQQEMRPLHQLYLDRHHTLLHPDAPASKAFQSRIAANTTALRLRYSWI